MNTPAPRDDLATSQPDSPDAAARTRLRSLGSRVTEPRVPVLAVLMQGDEPLSHQAVCDALPDDAGIDRVTVYRVLDWLVAGIRSRSFGFLRIPCAAPIFSDILSASDKNIHVKNAQRNVE